MQPRPLTRVQPYPARVPVPTSLRQVGTGYEPAKDFTESMRTIWRNRRLVFACTGGLALAAVVVALILPSTYAADARIEVGVREPHIWSTDQQLPPACPDSAAGERARIAAQSRD